MVVILLQNDVFMLNFYKSHFYILRLGTYEHFGPFSFSGHFLCVMLPAIHLCKIGYIYVMYDYLFIYLHKTDDDRLLDVYTNQESNTKKVL